MIFVASAALAVGALAWISYWSLSLERTLRQEARLEENVRLALWRMDSLAGAVIARENARPHFVYSPVYPVSRCYNWDFSRIEASESVVSSALRAHPEHTRLHFQIDAAGGWSSPQVDSPHGAQDGQSRLAALQRDITREDIDAALPVLLPEAPEPLWADNVVPPSCEPDPSTLAQAALPDNDFADVQQQQLNFNEQQARRMVCNAIQFGNGIVEVQLADKSEISTDVIVAPPVAKPPTTGPMLALRLGGKLILARRVVVGSGAWIQGCELEETVLSKALLERIGDLLPAAQLVATSGVAAPAEIVSGAAQGLGPNAAGGHRFGDSLPTGLTGGAGNHGGPGVSSIAFLGIGRPSPDGRRLESVPLALVPGALAPDTSRRPFTSWPLISAWGFLLLAVLAVALLLAGALRLSERRAAFVSAVTHELRTPLTTMRMYTEMLAEDMVPTAEKRRTYFRKLQSESERLGHLVDNVLAYARLERRNAAPLKIENLRLGEVVDRARERLVELASSGGLELEISLGELAAESVQVDPSAVERILFNLVDNAAKYARSGDPRLELTARSAGADLTLSLRDHGPGIGDKEVARLFEPFTKSDRDVARTAPGVGLGLALCRDLARSLGGNLEYIASADGGATFLLTLPGRACSRSSVE